MTGEVEHLAAKKDSPNPDKPTFGFIRGEDKVSYFFIPQGMQQTTTRFDALKVGMKVEFTTLDHPKGPRAIEVRVIGD